MGRKILVVTTDQQRYDALGCNGGTIARTPAAQHPDDMWDQVIEVNLSSVFGLISSSSRR